MFPVNIRVVVVRETYKEPWLQGPSAIVALPAACSVNTGPYRALRYSFHTFDRVLRTFLRYNCRNDTTECSLLRARTAGSSSLERLISRRSLHVISFKFKFSLQRLVWSYLPLEKI
jgi:hypothetical protein